MPKGERKKGKSQKNTRRRKRKRSGARDLKRARVGGAGGIPTMKKKTHTSLVLKHVGGCGSGDCLSDCGEKKAQADDTLHKKKERVGRRSVGLRDSWERASDHHAGGGRKGMDGGAGWGSLGESPSLLIRTQKRKRQ